MLQRSEVSRILLDLRLVDHRAVVEKDLTIVEASRRHSVFVATQGRTAYVLKQVRSGDAGALAHEADILRVLARDQQLAAHLPTVVHHDRAEALLILRSVGGAQDWSVHHHAGVFPLLPARALGRALSALHRLPADIVDGLPRDADPMWALSLTDPPYEILLDLSSGAQDVVGRLQSSSWLCARFDELRNAGATDDVVHGDLRWDNCLAVAAPTSRRRTRLILVDWELAGLGAAAFDVGTVLAEYLRAWVGSIPILDGGNQARLKDHAANRLRRIQPAVQTFWAAYRVSRPAALSLPRAIEFAAVRLVQTAVERAQGLGAATTHVLALVQLADAMLRRPEDAASKLLRLRD
jgi:aminoglycoside phosphotransferase (APT) family kinase protein